MSIADGVFTGNPWVAIGTALYRGIIGSGPRRFFGSNIERILAQAAPPPSTGAGSPREPVLREVIDNSPTRPRTPGGPGYRPPSWQVSPLPGPWIPPETDQDFEDFERDTNARWQGFVGPIPAPLPRPAPLPTPTIPDTLPRPLPRVPPSALPGVLARVLALPWLIFYPSRTADDDTVPGPMPQRIPTRGPTRRPRVRTLPDRQPGRQPRPYFPDDFPMPGDRPDTVSLPRPDELPRPLPRLPTPAPTPRPRSPTRPTPTPAPPPTGLPFWLPLLPQLLPRIPGRLPNRIALPDTLTPPQRVPLQYPPAQPFAIPLQARPANCPPCENQRQRKRQRKCTNPITSRRTFARGGAKFRTITRKLQCRV